MTGAPLTLPEELLLLALEPVRGRFLGNPGTCGTGWRARRWPIWSRPGGSPSGAATGSR